MPTKSLLEAVGELKAMLEKGSYFEECPRDEAGHCKPSGQGDEEGGDSGDSHARDMMARWDELDQMRRVTPPPARPETDEEIQAVQDYKTETGKFFELMLVDAGGDAEQTQKSKDTLAEVTKWMSVGMQYHIRKNLGDIKLYSSTDELTNNLYSMMSQDRPDGLQCGGFFAFNPGDRVGGLHVDGGYPGRPETVKEIYAHELGHAVDGVGRTFSRDDAWLEAWRSEIDKEGNPLSQYARRNPIEGFAEFSRLLMTGRYREARTEFPKCYAFWKEKGIL